MAGRVLILGAGGFIGRHLLGEFRADARWHVQGFDSQTCDLLSPGSIARALADLTDEDSLVVASTINRLKQNDFEALKKNLQMAENLGRFLAGRAAGHVTFLSTCDVYGLLPDGEVIQEDLIPDPADHYALSKLASEHLLKCELGRSGTPLTVLRLSGVYGPGDAGKSTIHRLVRAAAENGKITVYGDGQGLRDYVHANDVFRLARRAVLEKPAATVNVASGRSRTILEIIGLIQEALDRKITVEHVPESGDERRIRHMVFDIAFLRQTFPGFVTTDLAAGLRDYACRLLGRD